MSATGKHTPGPWTISDGAILCDKVNAYGNFYIAGFARGDCANTPEDYANANLLAAAPDLLAALKDPCMMPALEAWAKGCNANAVRCLENARAAMAKAEGRQA